MDDWLPIQIFHRQMYVDLVRAYLANYGTQRSLAKNLGIHEVTLSSFLEPIRGIDDGRRSWYWLDLLSLASPLAAKAPTEAKVISSARMQQLVEYLCTDIEHRKALLYHMEQAKKPSHHIVQAQNWLSGEVLRERIRRIGNIHAKALFGSNAYDVGTAYIQVWNISQATITQINRQTNPLEYAQVLLFLNDAAATLNRQDLALRYARQALLVLTEYQPTKIDDKFWRERWRINALVAETRALNSLGLKKDVLLIADHAKRMPGYDIEPATWKRSILEPV